MIPHRHGSGSTKQRVGLLAVVFVFLLQAMAWASTPMVSVSQNDGVISICTPGGIKTMSLAEFDAQLDLDQDPQDQGSHAPGSFCVLCPLMSALATLPSTATLPMIDLVVRIPRAPPTVAAIFDGLATSHQPRAPPFIG